MDNPHEGIDARKLYNGATTSEEILESLSTIQPTKARILENYDLTNPVDCYLLKPYLGHLPQDFSNVWMTMNCLNNVYFSLALRQKN